MKNKKIRVPRRTKAGNLPYLTKVFSGTKEPDIYVPETPAVPHEVFPKNSQGKERNRGYKITF